VAAQMRLDPYLSLECEGDARLQPNSFESKIECQK
jgi:hypothetical protein